MIPSIALLHIENVGEGWALTLGSITEEKEAGGSIWYFINGVDNVSDRLIPDSTTIQAGTNFGTEHLSYLKVIMVNASFDSQQCFHVWDTQGNPYQFGCTRDSFQYYTDSSKVRQEKKEYICLSKMHLSY